MPSQKVRAFIRNFMYAAPNDPVVANQVFNIGYATWRPTLANDVGCVTATNGVAPVGAVSGLTAFNSANWSTVTYNMTKIPYSAAQFTASNVEGRLVSGCLRIRYAGEEDIRSGVVSLFEDPDHLDVGPQSVSSISSFDSCGKQRPSGDGQWHQINWSGPARQAETEYVRDDGQAVPTVGAFTVPCIVIAVNQQNMRPGGAAVALQSAIYELECWQNLEFIGRDVVGKTNNQLDEQGSKNVFGAAKVAQSQSDPLAPNSPAAQVFRNNLRQAFAPKQGGTALGNFLQGAASAIHPGLGAAWGIARAGLNAGLARQDQRRASGISRYRSGPLTRGGSYFS